MGKYNTEFIRDKLYSLCFLDKYRKIFKHSKVELKNILAVHLSWQCFFDRYASSKPLSIKNYVTSDINFRFIFEYSWKMIAFSPTANSLRKFDVTYRTRSLINYVCEGKWERKRDHFSSRNPQLIIRLTDIQITL